MQHLGKVFEQQVAQTVADLKKKLEQEFQWYVIGTGWSLIELQTIYQVGLDIQNYIDVKGLTNGNAWILQNLGNTNFVHASWGDSHGVTLPKFPGGATVKLGKTWLNDPIWTPNELVAHELGHVWDIHTGLAASADLIGDLGGGSVWFFGKPVNAPQWNPRVHNVGSDAYGNLQRNDYFAEAFSVTIYSPTLTPPGVSTWIDANISNPAFASVLTVDPSDPVP
jgi:hypothetical protein